MPKIVPKSIQSQSSQNVKSNQPRNENTESDVMFAALFGGARGETKSDESLIGKASMTTMMSAVPGEENSFDEQVSDDLKISDDLMALMASVQDGRGLGQKVTGLQDDALNDGLELEQGPTSPDSENADALALATSGALSPETQGGKTAMPRSALVGLANMVFEDGVGPNARTAIAAAHVVPKNPARMDGNSSLGQNKAPTEIVGPQQGQQNSAKVVENLGVNMENPLIKNMTSDLVKLQALRAANLEQQNADVEKEAAKADLGELNGKLGKNGLTVAGLRQMVVSTINPPLAAKVVSLGERGRTANDVTRLATASSTALDNVQAITGTGANASSTGQSGAHTGHQGSAQSGSQSGSGLLGSLNNLQILDTAKGNWTEMLLQRVKNGLSGGKDQLDFQLNPRNLGKMRISLVMQNDRTNIQILTETSAAASMLSDSETRLAQMLEASGLRLGNLNSGQFQGFGGAGSDQQAGQQTQSKTGSLNQPDDVQGEVVDELVTEGSDNLINIQA
jgi:flagellar hook-length control protein FliK